MIRDTNIFWSFEAIELESEIPNRSQARGFEYQLDSAICQHREYSSHHLYLDNIFWVIECAKTNLDQDLKIKLSIYAELGIQEDWIVNIQKNILIVIRSRE